MASFETQFFGARVSFGVNKDKRPCKFCNTLVTDHQARRRNHLKGAVPGGGCATGFQFANGGRTFREYVLATQSADVINKVFGEEPAPMVKSPLSAGWSATGALEPGSGGGASGDRGVRVESLGFGPTVGELGGCEAGASAPPFTSGGGGGGAVPLGTCGPLLDSTTTATAPTSAQAGIHATGASGKFVVGNVLRAPSPSEVHTFKRQLLRVMVACGYSAHSIQHPEWKELVKLLRPGMEGYIPNDGTLLCVRGEGVPLLNLHSRGGSR